MCISDSLPCQSDSDDVDARDVLAAAQSLREEGKLRHGAGLFPFHGFSIHL